MAVAFKGVRGAIVLLALTAAIAVPYSSAAANTPLRGRATLEGQLVVMHADDFGRGRSADSHAVLTDAGDFVATDLSRVRGVDRLVGKRVKLAGDASDSQFVATSDLGARDAASADAADTAASVATNAAASSTEAAASVRRTAVILVNFTNDKSQPWTEDFVSNTVFGATNSVAAYYREVSYGTSTVGGTVFGWLTIPYDNTGCRYSDWGRAALSASGVDPDQYAHVIFAFPRAYGCTWAGLSTVGGKYAWINGFMTLRTVGHEVAHMLGVHHASALNCTSSGARVTYSSTCTRSEYGDPFSIMGLGTRHHNHWHRAQIGWLPEMQTVTSSGYYAIAPAELTVQPRLVRVARGDGTFLYLEFRQAFGVYDTFTSTAAGVKGVSVRIAPDKPSRVQSLLLDMTPSTTTFEDAPLAVGRSFTDPVSGVTLTTTAVSAAGATVGIRFAGTNLVAPSASPTNAPSPTASPSATPRPSTTPAPTASPSATPTSPAPTPTATPQPSATATPSPTASPPSDPLLTITAPKNVRAVRLDGRRVRVRWEESAGEVVRYRVIRNGVRIGATTSLRFYDRVPRNITRAVYVVRAVDRWGNLGPRSRWYALYMR